jgi:facilitated trehalose transporter
MFMALGMLITYIVGALLPWHYLSFFCAAFPVMLLIALFLLPESPVWLMSHGYVDRAAAALEWLRNGRNIK